MNESVSLNQSRDFDGESCQFDLSSLMAQLDQFRRKNERLAQLNELHARLAGAIDLPGMIEAFSIWLMPLVEHDLVAYTNSERQRSHMYCSCHGPERQRVFKVAERLFHRLDDKKEADWYEDDYHVRNWYLDSFDSSGLLLILRRDRSIGPEGIELINEGLAILQEPLSRALEYEDLFEIARRDSLTGLSNRRVFEERIGPLMDTARRHDHPLTLACMDLDHFKQINDNLGHNEGDRVLQEVAATFKNMVRSSDLLVRMGGDEFLLVLPETDLDSARILANRLCRAIENLDIYSAPGEKLGVSIGLSQWQPGVSREEWLQQTDELLYDAKDRGRCQVCF